MPSLIPVRSRHCLSLSLSLLVLSWWCARAQNADEFFHGGAQRFLTNNIPGALEVVTNGLQHFPNDEKLQKLYELLNQQQQQQQNQQDQQDQNQDQQKDQKQDQQKQDEKKDQEQKSKNEQQKKDEKKQPEAKGKKEQQAKSDKQAKGKPEEKPGEQQPMEAHAMTPQEAKQLLDAQKGDEQVLIFQPKVPPPQPGKQLKDW
ncbi:MAG: hypothetical protein QM813_10085 [Verrucomicrobiota bacterium]